jgi:hypothetical protein
LRAICADVLPCATRVRISISRSFKTADLGRRIARAAVERTSIGLYAFCIRMIPARRRHATRATPDITGKIKEWHLR